MNAHTRRAFLRDFARFGASMAGLAALAGCSPVRTASGPARVYRVGLLGGIPAPALVIPPLWARLEELGYVEGQNLVKIDRSQAFAEANQEVVGPLAMELARLPVDVIVVGNLTGVRAAMAATRSIPIVMMNVNNDPVAPGLVASLARPGGNVTGVLGFAYDLEPKRLQQLVEAVPTVSKVAVLAAGGALAGGGSPQRLQATAEALGVTLVAEPVQARDDIEAAFEHAVAEGADALLVGSGSVPTVHADLVIELAARHRLPASYVYASNVKAGGLMAYEPRVSEIGWRTADYVDRILRGTNPADLPVELPTDYDLTVNLRTARTLGVTFPQSFMAQVTTVIE